MRFIQQLTETINPRLSDIISSVPSDNMLEQFYAIYIMRLCDKALLAQLSVLTDTSNLFERAWTQKSHRDIICRELSQSHHLEEELTFQLISEASPLVYQQIEQQANHEGLSVFDFLQSHVNDIKMFFPIWIDSVISKAILSGEPQKDVEPPTVPSALIDNDEVDENFTEMNTADTPAPIENQDIVENINTPNVDAEEQPAYAGLAKGKKKTKRKKTKAPRRKKPLSEQDKARRKKILIIAIPLIILNFIIIGAWLWFKKTSDAEKFTQDEVILTTQQNEDNQGYAVPPAQPIESNNQDMGMFPPQPPQADGQNMGMPPQQGQQANGQNMGVPPMNQNMVPPAQPPQPQPSINQNMVPPAQPPQPMNMPPNGQMDMQPQPPMPAYNEPPVVNAPPQQPTAVIQSPNEMVFEFNNNDEGGISEAQLDELTNVEIISEKLENQP